MKILEKLGLFLAALGIMLFTYTLVISGYTYKADSLTGLSEYHQGEIDKAVAAQGLLNKEYSSGLAFAKDFKQVLKSSQEALAAKAADGIPDGVAEWDFKLSDNTIGEYTKQASRGALSGPVKENPLRWFFLTIGLAALGGLIYCVPQFMTIPGIKHDDIFHSRMTRGLSLPVRSAFLVLTIGGILWFGISYMSGSWFHSLHTLLLMGVIVALVLFREKDKGKTPARSASPSATAWFGVIMGTYLIGFYILLYWFPQFISPWIEMVDPISRSISGNGASQWFLYGLLYTLIMLVMGIRMIAKYRHNKYQIIRTCSVMFFQTAFAFLIPEILMRLNQPYYDFKNIWPLNYSFFFDWNINQLMDSGGLGVFMLVWGIVLILVGVPVITYFYGKRWYCSWVCGCGGLAETMGDPYRQLSDKSLRAWKIERYTIHAVLVFSVVMTIAVLYHFFTGSSRLLFMDSYQVRTWYGFLIGSAFAGVIGTGFYPLMGNRMWCRFGCPLAAYLGLVQKFKSRFRITVNGGQCISCGNCSTYCEMGIDVRHYAQRGQDVVRSSCVGCGVCAAVCPRGVLRLENGSVDLDMRGDELRTVHIKSEDVGILS